MQHAHSQKFRAVSRYASSLSDDFSREDKVLQDLLMDDSQSPAHGALLLHTRGAGRLAEHTPLCNENDVTIGELLLKLAGKPGIDDNKTMHLIIRKSSSAHLA